MSIEAQVEVELSFDIERCCEHCGKTHAACVIARGDAHSTSTSPSTSGGADLWLHAELAAKREAAELANLASCPRCGRRNGSAVRRLMVVSLGWLAAAAAMAVIGWFTKQNDMLGIHGAIVLALIAGISLFMAPLTAWVRWRDSTRRVRFAERK